MRKLIARVVLAALFIGVGPFALGETDQPKAKDSLSVAQLETAGDVARAAKNYEEAVDYFQAALRRDNRNAVLYNKLGITYLRMNDLRNARYNFDKAVKRDSKFADAFNNIGAVYYMQRQYNQAAKQFKKAVALEETRASFHVNLGATWFAQKKLDRALAEYARALEINPDALRSGSTGVSAQIASPEERARYAFMLAKIFAQRGDTDMCIKNLRKAKEEGYHEMANVYKDAEFASVRNDPRLSEIVPAPQQ